ncbi:MAG: c-type cytochrome [Spirochaetia bacterium]|nr:c-type cytochrome [Spirochaetia bacterium]
MEFRKKNTGSRKIKKVSLVFSVFYITTVFGFSFVTFCNSKKTSLKEQLIDHKISTLMDTTELNQNGENPLEGNAEAIAKGAVHYSTMCSVCHGTGAQGSTGPDLLDNAWLHGNDNYATYNIIMNGIRLENMKMNPPRGKMPPYKNILGSHKILEIMAWLADQKSKLKENPDN